jgi:hypothetical protein
VNGEPELQLLLVEGEEVEEGRRTVYGDSHKPAEVLLPFRLKM